MCEVKQHFRSLFFLPTSYHQGAFPISGFLQDLSKQSGFWGVDISSNVANWNMVPEWCLRSICAQQRSSLLQKAVQYRGDAVQIADLVAHGRSRERKTWPQGRGSAEIIFSQVHVNNCNFFSLFPISGVTERVGLHVLVLVTSEHSAEWSLELFQTACCWRKLLGGKWEGVWVIYVGNEKM